MHPPTHALLSWGLANLAPSLDRRGRALVFFAGLIPDLDGVTYFASERLYLEYHRVLCHNGAFGILCAAAAAALAGQGAPRAFIAALAFASFHLHLVCDLLGSAGPDGSLWGIPYFQPLCATMIDNPYQWQLASVPNVAITLGALAFAIVIALRRGRSPVEPFSARADAAVVAAIRRRLAP
jgi:hypothetical protein